MHKTNKIKEPDELINTDKECIIQNKEEDNCAEELIIANEKLDFKKEEKEKRAAELVIANKELAFQNEEKEKRAAELIIANKELVFQNKEKEKRATELIIANKELLLQNKEKEKWANELIIINKELKKAEEELKEKEFFLRESQRAGNIGSYKTNFVKGSWQSSETLDSIFGIDKNYNRSIAGWLDIVHPDDKQKLDEYLRLEVIGKRKSFNKEYRIKKINDQQTRWVCGNGEVKFDNSGNITEMIGTIQDITERKNAEELLFNSQQDYKNLLRNMNDGFVVDNISGKVTFVNKRFLEIFGLEEGDINDFVIEDYVAPGYTEMLRDRHNHRISGEKVSDVFIFEGLRKDGKKIWLEVRVNQVIKNGIITGTQSVISDITNRKKEEEKLKESNERYEFVNKATQDTIWEWDYHTKRGIWGEGIMTTFGYSEDKLNYGETWLDEYVHPDDKERLLKNIYDRIENSLETCQNEYRFRCADGSYKYVFDRGYILYDENKKPYRMIGAMTDITETKRLERELADQQIKQNKILTETIIQTQEQERNELGRELHDNINQILATVKMYLGMVKAKENVSVDLVSQSYEYVNEAMEEIRKLSHSLVAPSLGDIGLKEALQALVEDANLLNKAQVQLLFDEKCNEMVIDKNKKLMLYRIVQEQMNNIAKYANAGKVFITLKKGDDILILSVVDDGVGFDPMQKSKGIGLKNISSRVEFYSGHMNIISAPGQGCTLEVFIPV